MASIISIVVRGLTALLLLLGIAERFAPEVSGGAPACAAEFRDHAGIHPVPLDPSVVTRKESEELDDETEDIDFLLRLSAEGPGYPHLRPAGLLGRGRCSRTADRLVAPLFLALCRLTC